MNKNLTLLQLCLIIQPHVKEMYLVGGCVRDMMLKRTPKDFDLVVNGNLDIIEEILNWKEYIEENQEVLNYVSVLKDILYSLNPPYNTDKSYKLIYYIS